MKRFEDERTLGLTENSGSAFTADRKDEFLAPDYRATDNSLSISWKGRLRAARLVGSDVTRGHFVDGAGFGR